VEQQINFLKLIENNRYKLLYRFYLLSGCRKSEAINLRWSDIDFNNKFIHIQGTKTLTSDRFIPLFPAIYELLNLLPKVSDKVFNCTENALNCNFKRLKIKYSLPFKLHDLRHTFATRCLENGISLKLIQKWLGHSRLETTSNIYTHVLTAYEREEILKYDPKI
jgi:integrase